MPRKDKNITPSVTEKLQSLGYNVADWDDSQSDSKIGREIRQVLLTASKKANGKLGMPDRIYVNEYEKLLILVEEKSAVKDHANPDKGKGAVSGVQWYLSRFYNTNLTPHLKGFFDDWKMLGIAISGDLSLEYQHKFDCYTVVVKEEKTVHLNQVTNFMTEEQFLALFNSFDEEQAVAAISSSSKKINNLLRPVDSQKRPVLLSALMISLHKVSRNSQKYTNEFPEHYKTYSPGTLIANVLNTVNNLLKAEGIPTEKMDVLDTELAFLRTDQTLNNSAILKDILLELESTVIPLFNSRFATSSNYDIIGKFYEEFLKYAGVSNVKKGIVLTPRHITTLFTKLIDLKENDKIVDLCCGTGAFLIASMNALIGQIRKSDRSDKEEAIVHVKANQLLGFELNTTMYICAVSNMLFRGDGKSSIHNFDSIYDPRTQEELDKFQATIGFINPPYGGKENASNPTPKEITFLVKMLDNCSRYGVIIAPISTFFKDSTIRENILKKHTLRYVINMPGDLFQPNAATHTAIAVFETNRAFKYESDEVVFYDLRDDGLALSKNKGRTDVYGRWPAIEKALLEALRPGSQPDDVVLVRTKIKPDDEWTVYAHSKTDYSTLHEDDFVRTVSDYVIFEAKRDLGILHENLSEAELLGAISSYYNGKGAKLQAIATDIERTHESIDTSTWREFNLIGTGGLFSYQHGTRLTVPDRIPGEIPLITAGQYNQGYAQSISNYDEKDCFEPGVTVDMFSNSFYQNSIFAADDNVYIFNRPQHMNTYAGLFLATVINKQKYKYGYGRQFRKDDAEKNKILLPVTLQGEPDWLFMETYVKSLPYAEYVT